MVDRVVVLRAEDAESFVADGCAALADAVNEIRLVVSSDSVLVDAYAEMVVAYARLVRPRLLEEDSTVRLAVMDHLVERVAEVRSGLIALPVLDIVDRLHGELTGESARA